jgi:hypothetical protein
MVPPVQMTPQAPQFWGSVVVSTHALPHASVIAEHDGAHALEAQTSPVAHVMPHAPQLPGSVVRSTQRPPQFFCPAGQRQTPFTQCRPPEH